MIDKDGEEYVYVMYSKEQPHLPEIVANDLQEMSKKTGASKSAICAYIKRGYKRYAKVKIS